MSDGKFYSPDSEDVVALPRRHLDTPERRLQRAVMADACGILRRGKPPGWSKGLEVYVETLAWVRQGTVGEPGFRFDDICDAHEVDPCAAREVIARLGRKRGPSVRARE